MTLFVQPQPAGGIHFEATLNVDAPRGAIALLDRSLPRSREVISMCSICKAVRCDGERVGDEARWIQLEEAMSRLRLAARDPLPRIIHGVCPSCATTYEASAPRSPA